jgi:amidase
MRLPEYDQLDALGLAALVARGEVRASELLEAALERADARDPALNALAARFDDEARSRARGPLPPGPLSGVPFLVKELLTAWAGHPLSGGSRFTRALVASDDSAVVLRLQAAGLVLFGQTCASELGIRPVTETALRGPCRNPWNPGFTVGGSSGGAGAAVAARIVPAAQGNDTGGSLRIPASCCGVFALKPSRGRVTFGPLHGALNGGMTTEGVVTRTVRDSAALLDVIAGAWPGDPFALPPPARPFLSEVGAPPGRLRVAVTASPLFARATHPACAAAVARAARLLADLGHEVVEAHPPIDREPLMRAYLVLVAAQTAEDVGRAAAALGHGPRRGELEPETAMLAAAGRALPAAEVLWAEAELHRAGRALAAFHAEHDVLVTSTLAQPPLPIGALRPRAHERAALRAIARFPARRLVERLITALAPRSFDATGNTMLFNQTGQPAASVPLATSPDGLPIGVQLAARVGEEPLLLRLAAQLEEAAPWAGRAPGIVAAHQATRGPGQAAVAAPASSLD